MRLRTRLTASFTGVTAVALIASFSVAYAFVQRDELREIDHALLVQAEHAAVVATERSPDDPRVKDGTSEMVEPPTLTTRYAATYERDDGQVVSLTRSFGEAPKIEHPDAGAGTPVDFVHHGIHLRGVLVPLGTHRTLLYAVPRTGIDQDLSFLVRIFALLLVAATTLTWLVARSLARSLVRDVDALYEVADAVAAGKLDARVGGRAKGSIETKLLAERMDRMIERLAELVASQRVFISSAAHELRSPLTSLRGELELALRRERTAPEYKETIETALADAVSLVTLADDLLAIARIENRRGNGVSKDVTRVSDLMEEATRMARGNAEARKVEVVVVTPSRDVAVSCSRKEVARALRNLLDNAIAHSPNGKSVSMKTAVGDGHVDIAVEDEGAGVREEDASLLFAPFWRGTGERAGAEGAGLGLALAREIARAEGGDIAFDAAFAPGARFVLTLPLHGWIAKKGERATRDAAARRFPRAGCRGRVPALGGHTSAAASRARHVRSTACRIWAVRARKNADISGVPVPLLLPILLQIAAADAAPPARVLRLSEAVDTAMKAQPTLAQAKAQTSAAEGRAQQARQLYFPQVTATASYSRVRSASIGGGRGAVISGSGSGAGTGGGATGTTPTAIATTSTSGVDIFTLGGNATQLIWDFGSVRDRAHAADKLVESFQANEHASTRAVIVDVRRAFFTARAQKSLITVAKQSLENFQLHLTQIEGFVKVGTRPEIDLAQAKTDVANARLSLITSTNAYSLAKANLGRAMGTAGAFEFEVADDELPVVDNEEGSVDQLVERAGKARPDVVVYERQRESYELQAKGYKAQYWPTLSASVGASETGTDLGDLGPAWNIGAAVNWPFFQGFLTHGQIREAEGNANVARAQIETVKLQIRVDVQQAQLGIRAAKESQKAAAEAETNAKERLRLAEGRYTAGVGSVIELGDAQLAVATASAQVIQANFNLSSARADLLAAMGER